jgi:hypothetical protein
MKIFLQIPGQTPEVEMESMGENFRVPCPGEFIFLESEKTYIVDDVVWVPSENRVYLILDVPEM